MDRAQSLVLKEQDKNKGNLIYIVEALPGSS